MTMVRSANEPLRVRPVTDAGNRRRSIAVVLLAATLVLAAPGGAACAGEWGPWSAGEVFPVLASRADETSHGKERAVSGADSPAGLPLIALIRIYQAWFSPVIGDRCQMTPSCSQYGIDAIRKHGPLLGIVMTSGRLLHEADERRYAPIRVSGKRYRFSDPVENNDFWFGAR